MSDVFLNSGELGDQSITVAMSKATSPAAPPPPPPENYAHMLFRRLVSTSI